MMKPRLFLAIVLALGFVTLVDAVEVKATNDSGLQILESVYRVHNLFDEKNDVTVRLFEMGGGDPAMNGDVLLLTIIPGNREQAALTWKTGITVYTVTGAEIDPGRSEVVIKVQEHIMGPSGEIDEHSEIYTIEYEVDRKSGAISDMIRTGRSTLAVRLNDFETHGLRN